MISWLNGSTMYIVRRLLINFEPSPKRGYLTVHVGGQISPKIWSPDSRGTGFPTSVRGSTSLSVHLYLGGLH